MPVQVEQVKREILRHTVYGQGFGIWLKCADEHLLAFGADIERSVVISGARHEVVDAGNWPGEHVMMLNRVERDIESVIEAKLPRPHAAAEQNRICRNLTCSSHYPGCPDSIEAQRINVDAFD